MCIGLHLLLLGVLEFPISGFGGGVGAKRELEFRIP